jgi:hypothetical protein
MLKNVNIAERALTILIGALLGFSGATVAEPHADLIRTHEGFHKALCEADADALGRVLDDHFIWTHTDGLVQTKSELLAKIRDAKLRYSELSTDQETFNEYAQAAVVTGHSARRYAEATKPFEIRYTLTFVKSGHDWKVSAYHTTIVTPVVGHPLYVYLGFAFCAVAPASTAMPARDWSGHG